MDHPSFPVEEDLYASGWADDGTDSEIAKMSRGAATFIAVLFIGYLVLGLTGNFLTIMALLRCPRVRNVTAAFIISLCVADFLFCLLVLPWEVSRFLAGKWLWGEGWICTLFPLLRYWNVAVSLLSIAMITINRYIMIAHFSVYKLVYRKGWIALMIAFCWVFAFVMLLPTLLNKWGRFGFDRRLQTCSILDEENKSPKQVLFGLGFCVPAIIIIICYSLIFYVIHKSEKRIRQHTSRSVNGSHHGPSLQHQARPAGKVDKEVRRRRNEWRITKMVLIIFIAFLITYLPITLVKNLDKQVNYPGLHVLGYVLIYISSCINPVIYVIMNRQYRQAYKTVVLCKRPRLPSLTSSHSELEKAASCRRYEAIKCHSCMSRPHPALHSPPPSSHPARPHSLHDVSNHIKKTFYSHLMGFETPDTQSLENVSLENLKPSVPCQSCENLKRTHASECVKCQTRRNTRRNTVLGTPIARPASGVSNRITPGHLDCCPQAFIDHLLDLDPSHTLHSTQNYEQINKTDNQSNINDKNASTDNFYDISLTTDLSHKSESSNANNTEVQRSTPIKDKHQNDTHDKTLDTADKTITITEQHKQQQTPDNNTQIHTDQTTPIPKYHTSSLQHYTSTPQHHTSTTQHHQTPLPPQPHDTPDPIQNDLHVKPILYSDHEVPPDQSSDQPFPKTDSNPPTLNPDSTDAPQVPKSPTPHPRMSSENAPRINLPITSFSCNLPEEEEAELSTHARQEPWTTPLHAHDNPAFQH